jgi:hypothetical protein
MCYQRCPGENNNGECTLHRFYYCDYVVCDNCENEFTVLEFEEHKKNCKEDENEI